LREVADGHASVPLALAAQAEHRSVVQGRERACVVCWGELGAWSQSRVKWCIHGCSRSAWVTGTVPAGAVWKKDGARLAGGVGKPLLSPRKGVRSVV
jgi:uncharacterized protein YaeQ